MPDDEHLPVLLDEAVAALSVKPQGIYLDATFGRGGHARAILALLDRLGRLIALDRDPHAAQASLAIDDSRFHFEHARFSDAPAILSRLGISGIDGALLDLGIASPQIDDPERGFSFQRDGPLDMRMDPSCGESAADWLAHATEREIGKVIFDYGEERFAKSIARAIVAARTREPICRTRQLAALVAQGIRARPRRDRSQDPATRTFQALRIFINQELQELSLTLPAMVNLLNSGGRLAVISFHSLEDRMVKQFFARESQPYEGDPRLARLPLATDLLPTPPLSTIGRAIRPSAAEVAANPRARSAVLRIAERTIGKLAQ